MALHQIPQSELVTNALRGKTVAVLGYGSQGHAHALNLRDSGLRVIVGQRTGSSRHDDAVAAGFETTEIADATRRADLLIFALPDDAMSAIFERDIGPHLRPGQSLGFIHGFAITYEQVKPPTGVDVVLVAPKAQGHAVRREYVAGRGALCLLAVEQDATHSARQTACAWAAGIGASRSAALLTTFRDETETDLFGEQAVLCGGLTRLIESGFQTLVDAGYPEELAFFECCHEIKLIVDLVYQHGLAEMESRISSTARFGSRTRGDRIIDNRTRDEMKRMLQEIRSGDFAREFLATRDARQSNPTRGRLDSVGARLRALMRLDGRD